MSQDWLCLTCSAEVAFYELAYNLIDGVCCPKCGSADIHEIQEEEGGN
jgi:DNA-directed RNA polymerase subunit RPC12/RpoP